MIFYKIWRETRWRFFALLATLGVVLAMVGYSEFGGASDLPAQNWWADVSEAWVAASFVIVVLLATVLGPGGLVTEVSEGVASFSVSLPICRSDYHWKRALVCFGELAAVSVLSIALLILAGSLFQAPPFKLTLLMLPLWMSLSAFVVFALSFLFSSWLTDRLTPVVLVIALFTSLCISFLLITHRSPPFMAQMMEVTNQYLMDWSGQNLLAKNIFSWNVLASNALISILLLRLAIRTVQRRDF